MSGRGNGSEAGMLQSPDDFNATPPIVKAFAKGRSASIAGFPYSTSPTLKGTVEQPLTRSEPVSVVIPANAGIHFHPPMRMATLRRFSFPHSPAGIRMQEPKNKRQRSPWIPAYARNDESKWIPSKPPACIGRLSLTSFPPGGLFQQPPQPGGVKPPLYPVGPIRKITTFSKTPRTDAFEAASKLYGGSSHRL